MKETVFVGKSVGEANSCQIRRGTCFHKVEVRTNGSRILLPQQHNRQWAFIFSALYKS